MDPGQHVAHVTNGIVRVELDGPRIAVRTALGQGVYEELHNGVASRAAVLVQNVPSSRPAEQFQASIRQSLAQSLPVSGQLTCTESVAR